MLQSRLLNKRDNGVSFELDLSHGLFKITYSHLHVCRKGHSNLRRILGKWDRNIKTGSCLVVPYHTRLLGAVCVHTDKSEKMHCTNPKTECNDGHFTPSTNSKLVQHGGRRVVATWWHVCALCTMMHMYCCQTAIITNVCWLCNDLVTLAS